MNKAARRQISIAAGTGYCGAGLGNEVVPWAKSYIAARQLGMTLVKPMWGFNRYNLIRDFGWSRGLVFAGQAAAAAWPSVTVTEEMFRSTRQDDYALAILSLAKSGAFDNCRVVIHEGMWGGYLAIRSAQSFIWREVLRAPRVIESLQPLREVLAEKIVVAVHVRLGDFADRSPGPGDFSSIIPLPWFEYVLSKLVAALRGTPYEVWLFSNGRDEELVQLNRMPNVRRIKGSVLSDLAAMASADLLICSVSSLSMLATFLSNRPYIWYAPQLSRVGQTVTLWGSEGQQVSSGSATRCAAAADHETGRGIPVSMGDDFPRRLSVYLRDSQLLRGVTNDLIMYGAVRYPGSTL